MGRRRCVLALALAALATLSTADLECNDIFVVTDPQEEHTTNLGLARHEFNDVIMHAIADTVQLAVSKGCHVFISAHVIAPNSCRVLSFNELMKASTREWLFGPPLVRVGAAKAPPKKSAPPTEAADFLNFAHLIGGPQSQVVKDPLEPNPPGPDDDRRSVWRAAAGSGGVRDDADEGGDGVTETKSKAVTLQMCKQLPPVARGRCNLLRPSAAICDVTKFPGPKWPPILAPGQGASFDTRLVKLLDSLPAEQLQLVHVVVKGMDRAAPPTTWSLMEGGCTAPWGAVRDVLTARLVPSQPSDTQLVPDEPAMSEWMDHHNPSTDSCDQTPLSRFLEDHMSDLDHVIFAGYMLDFTVVDTVRDMLGAIEAQREQRPGLKAPQLVVQAGKAVAMFPSRFDKFPPKDAQFLPPKRSLANIVDDLVLHGVVVDAPAAAISGIPVH